ncbi:MAG: glycosyltransferase family 2 protein [Candidatus Cloacimonetes bacterium]|nr:glycosyltransferase family 2 protein [Candidatus Cloacimonadota bacterium]
MELASIKNTAVVVPVYNSSTYLELLLQKVLQYFPAENVFTVDDGSSDSSFSIARQYTPNAVSLFRNFGKGRAIKTGLIESYRRGFLYAITIDSDLQHDPDDLLSFIKKQNCCLADMVIGNRTFSFSEIPLLRIIRNNIASRLVSLAFKEQVFDALSGYRLYNLCIFSRLRIKNDRTQFDAEALIKMMKANAVICSVKTKALYRERKAYFSYIKELCEFLVLYIKEFI